MEEVKKICENSNVKNDSKITIYLNNNAIVRIRNHSNANRQTYKVYISLGIFYMA